MRNDLLEDATAMIRAAGYTPRVERSKHWKVSWWRPRQRGMGPALLGDLPRTRWRSDAGQQNLAHVKKEIA